MSDKVLVSVFDKVAGLYSPVMTEVNPDSAIRNFKVGAVQNQQINACPEDYCLVLLGTFNDETGLVAPVETDDGSPSILFQAKDIFPVE